MKKKKKKKKKKENLEKKKKIIHLRVWRLIHNRKKQVTQNAFNWPAGLRFFFMKQF